MGKISFLDRICFPRLQKGGDGEERNDCFFPGPMKGSLQKTDSKIR